MPVYGDMSRKVLATLHIDLQSVFSHVLQLGADHILLCGYRDQHAQHQAFIDGKSKLDWPNSRHNTMPSLAVDVAPYYRSQPHIDWNYIPGIYHFAGVVRGVAAELYQQKIITHRIRWGGDWDRDFDVREKQWNDLMHYELVRE